MAQPLQVITVSAPGFRGLNTQDSPIGIDPSFLAVADNCVIDKSGRVAARKGKTPVTGSTTPLGSSLGITSISEYIDEEGTKTVFSTGNNKIFSGTSTLTDVTPGSYTVSADDWKQVSFNNHHYFFQRGQVPLVYSLGDADVILISADANIAGTAPQGNEVLAAFGRLWVGDIEDNTQTIYWSDLLNGAGWTGGTSGSINLAEVWPNGYDTITAIRAHNNFLIIFGKRSIIIYQGASSPASMTLADTIDNIGCIARDSVQSTGTDLIFLSDTGVRSLGRTIQESSLPFTDISRNVRTDVLDLVSKQTSSIRSVYSAAEAFYLLSFSDSSVVYCFDTRTSLEDGSYRVTLWPNYKALSFSSIADNTLYIGDVNGINSYSTTYTDNDATYQMRVYPVPMTFGDASRLKILKDINTTIIGGQNTRATLNWGFDYTENYSKQTFVVTAGVISEYNVAEFNVAEFSGSIIVDRIKTKPSGNGAVVAIGIDAEITGASFAVQELNIQALMGRII